MFFKQENYGLTFATKKEQSDFHDRINEIRFNVNGKNKVQYANCAFKY